MEQDTRFWSDTMVWLLVAWVCSLPLIALVVVPLLGREVGIATAVGLLIGLLVICWGWCGWQGHRPSSDTHGRSEP